MSFPKVGGVVALHVTDVRLEQLAKQELSIFVTEFPMDTDVKPEQR